MAGLKDIVTGKLFSGDSEAKERDILKEILKDAQGIETPDLSSITPTQYEDLYDFTPEKVSNPRDITAPTVEAALADVVTQGRSELNNISTDPRLRDAQMAALAEMGNIADAGGRQMVDDANLSRIQNQTAQQDRGRREAILQGARRRGMGGSGMELLAQLDSSQAATDRNSQAGLDIAAQAQQRALEAMMQSGQLGGQIRSQDFGEQERVASAQDAINRFNSANQNSMNQFNTSSLNNMGQFNAGNEFAADQFNVSGDFQADQINTGAANQYGHYGAVNTQNIGNMNTGLDNQFKIDIPQQEFQNDMTKLGAVSGAKQGVAGSYGAEAQRDRDAWGNVIQGATGIATAAAAPTPVTVAAAVPKAIPKKEEE